ncbi:MAG: aspartate aminotransferase family protein [Desulfurococcales archaeon]|nr:aspartate aminotransferase family protein [Desulfurococcales archaeon]
MIDKSCSNISKLLIKYTEIYRQRTPRSKQFYEKARSILPGGVTYKIRDFHPYPPYIIRGMGGKVIDIDGKEYTDYWMGHGALILGHSNPEIVRMIKLQTEIGTHYGYEHPLAVKWAEAIKRNYPSMEMIRFTNSGTEANSYAIRLARAYTKKKKIVKIQGGWHGSYNGLHVNVHPPFTGKPESPGIPGEFSEYTITVELNNILDLKEKISENRNDIAALIMEPVLGAGGGVPSSREFAEEARELCNRYNCLLIFDEVITGFRIGLGGGAEYLNVEPDLSVMGKIIGGGLPAGAFGGKREIMKLLDHREVEKHVFQGGTFTGNPLTASAGITAINFLERNREIYEHLGEIHSSVETEVNKISREVNMPLHVTGTRGITGIHFTSKKPSNAREVFEYRYCEDLYQLINLYMRINGILYVSESIMHLLPSIHHTLEDVGKLMSTLRHILLETIQ